MRTHVGLPFGLFLGEKPHDLLDRRPPDAVLPLLEALDTSSAHAFHRGDQKSMAERLTAALQPRYTLPREMAPCLPPPLSGHDAEAGRMWMPIGFYRRLGSMSFGAMMLVVHGLALPGTVDLVAWSCDGDAVVALHSR